MLTPCKNYPPFFKLFDLNQHLSVGLVCSTAGYSFTGSYTASTGGASGYSSYNAGGYGSGCQCPVNYGPNVSHISF